MKKADIYKLMDLIEEIKKVDAMILLHQDLDKSKFMVSQYEGRKTKLMGSLIDELISPTVQSPQSFSLIKQVIEKYYPANKTRSKDDVDIEKLAAAI
ncbi:MAG: hypothetical protein WBJ10_17540 [Daejeonella sp.]|uniref:hypothetical protein n=1 Tax=Daejeonella sp. TaxID=2805397 RepID=UPI003C71FC3F